MPPLPARARTFLNLARSGKYLDLLEAGLAALKRAGIAIQVSHFFTCDRADSLPRVPEGGFGVRLLGKEELAPIAEFARKDLQVYRRRMDLFQDECRELTFLGELVGYCWLSRKEMRVPELGFRRKLKPGEVYLYDGMIREDLRNRGFFGLFLVGLIREVVAGGGSFIISIDFTNYKSKGTYTKLGFIKTGTGILVSPWKIFTFRYQSPSLKS